MKVAFNVTNSDQKKLFMGSDYTTHVTAFHSPVLKCLCQNKINGTSFVTGVGEERAIRRWVFMVLKCLL